MNYYDKVKNNALDFHNHSLAGGFIFEHNNGSLFISPANAIDYEMANLVKLHKGQLIEIVKGGEVMNNTSFKQPVTVDNKSGKVLPTPKKIDLATIDDIRLEMASVYRSMKGGSIEASDGSRLVYVLGQIGKMIELHDIEKRVDQLEGKL